MPYIRKELLAVVLSLGMAWSCSGVDDASATEDGQLELDEAAHRRNGRGGRNADCDDGAGRPRNDAGRPTRPDPTPPDPTPPPPPPSVDDDGGTDEPPPSVDDDAGTQPPTGDIGGSATASSCSSTATPSGGKCGSYYCGVSQADIAASLPSDSLCPDVEAVCEGSLVGVISTCTRSTVIANLGTPVASLTPQIQACVYQDAEIKAKVSMDCLGCFMKAAECAVNKCLTDCLSDGPACDACRLKNACDQTVFGCAKLPDPF